MAETEMGEDYPPVICSLVRLLLFTGCRLREIMHSRRDWYDLDAKLLRLPEAAAKAGAREVVLTPPAIEVVNSIPEIKGNPYLIIGHRNGRPLINPTKLWNALKKKAELVDVHLHDLRHTHGAASVGNNFSLLMVGKLLGHKSVQSTERYSHLMDDPRDKAAGTTAATIEGWLEDNKGAELINLSARRRYRVLRRL